MNFTVSASIYTNKREADPYQLVMLSRKELGMLNIPFFCNSAVPWLKCPTDMEKLEPSYTDGGNLNWCRHYGNQHGDSLTNYK